MPRSTAPSLACLRTLNDITVLNSTAAPGEGFENREPFVTEISDGSKTFHPVASLPATYPLLSHITASVGIFDDFLAVSERMTELHDFDWAHVDEGKRAGVTIFRCRDEKCRRQPHLFMTKEPTLFIEAQEKPYVTLGEAVCAIDEWLLVLQKEILIAETGLWGWR
ncbi:hypothetical protein CH35J_010981 [Colletotrichum higginsianum]|uniref:Uncharacterized protein n=1 Tax=Colletotrichum higginsianum TaxID=80884 RepID=A0A4T0VJD7_9PEZI|nr:hypothetical protein CH35J_010981 [Colletotrichum higginsianum]